MDSLQPEEQLKSLQGADIVITSHGAQEVNMLGASACTAWVEIFPAGYFIPSYYGAMVEQYGMLYYYYYDRDQLAGKPKCMIEDPSLDPTTPGSPLMADQGKSDFQKRKCRRQAKMMVPMDELESVLTKMLEDHNQCIANGGRDRTLTDFQAVLRRFKELYEQDRTQHDILMMDFSEYARE